MTVHKCILTLEDASSLSSADVLQLSEDLCTSYMRPPTTLASCVFVEACDPTRCVSDRTVSAAAVAAGSWALEFTLVSSESGEDELADAVLDRSRGLAAALGATAAGAASEAVGEFVSTGAPATPAPHTHAPASRRHLQMHFRVPSTLALTEPVVVRVEAALREAILGRLDVATLVFLSACENVHHSCIPAGFRTSREAFAEQQPDATQEWSFKFEFASDDSDVDAREAILLHRSAIAAAVSPSAVLVRVDIDTPGDDDDDDLSSGAVAGIVVGCLVGCAVLVALAAIVILGKGTAPPNEAPNEDTEKVAAYEDDAPDDEEEAGALDLQES
ncbi:hypothetical protein DIPPA_19309 [Diplonema papillatum]|nr:hypothetical protein DIPPA_19309 [Diplonema papillatum]